MSEQSAVAKFLFDTYVRYPAKWPMKLYPLLDKLSQQGEEAAPQYSEPPRTEVERHEIRMLIRKQFLELKGDAMVTCAECERKIPVRFAFHCFNCGLWFCHACSEVHFRKTPQTEPQGLRELVEEYRSLLGQRESEPMKTAGEHFFSKVASLLAVAPTDGGLRAALEFYAEPRNYRSPAGDPEWSPFNPIQGDLDTDGRPGARARAALASVPAAPTVGQVLAWLRGHPGISWVATIQDIEEAVKDLSGLPATPFIRWIGFPTGYKCDCGFTSLGDKPAAEHHRQTGHAFAPKPATPEGTQEVGK
jgi:hypothetical protein